MQFLEKSWPNCRLVPSLELASPRPVWDILDPALPMKVGSFFDKCENGEKWDRSWEFPLDWPHWTKVVISRLREHYDLNYLFADIITVYQLTCAGESPYGHKMTLVPLSVFLETHIPL